MINIVKNDYKPKFNVSEASCICINQSKSESFLIVKETIYYTACFVNFLKKIRFVCVLRCGKLQTIKGR